MRVLVTRPQPAAETTAHRLETAGHEAVLMPLMRATHLVAAARSALDVPHVAIVLTSAEAVRVLVAMGEDLAKHLSTPCFCVGEATARAASDLGFADIRVGDGNGQALAELIVSTLDILPEQPLLYLTGTPRSSGLESTLIQHGIAHEAVECYRMTPIAQPPGAIEDAIRNGPLDAALLYSRETTCRLATLLIGAGVSAPAFASRYLCLSATIAEALPVGAVSQIAARPDEESLFRLL
ncbi:MAG TPA: uroporphyrinogen-III synthase [Ensifer sp.]|uniref:uroporphyrinogen-III synthase n=1 Tax=Ensifer sp. TaxID=1872086 RepID=UPI002E0EA061|nr:uroporphyrinogen-III synthase [Ensifer sp.]